MTAKPLQSKVFSFDRSSLWIEALVPGEEGVSDADAFSFRFADIRQIRGFGPENSLVTLDKGTEIIFNLPYDKLTRKIRECDDEVLDLKADTNLSGRGELTKKLKAAFAEAREAAKYAYIEALTITAFVRQSQETDFREFTFSGKDLKVRDMKDGGSIMGGEVITMRLKKPGGPFGTQDILLEGSLKEFQDLCREAYDSGRRALDLTDYSLRKGTQPPPEKQAELDARRKIARHGP